MDKRQLDFKVAEDEQKLKEEAEKELARRKHAQNLMIESEQRLAEMKAAEVNGANRGEKMTKEELRFNKDLLKEVAKIKKQGAFNNIHEVCASKKITNFD